MEWFVYIIQTQNGLYYCGITTNLKRRFLEHQRGTGAKFFRGIRRPQKIVYFEKCSNRSQAQKREYQIKKLDRREKEKLIFS